MKIINFVWVGFFLICLLCDIWKFFIINGGLYWKEVKMLLLEFVKVILVKFFFLNGEIFDIFIVFILC